jgi:hypothetical protein
MYSLVVNVVLFLLSRKQHLRDSMLVIFFNFRGYFTMAVLSFLIFDLWWAFRWRMSASVWCANDCCCCARYWRVCRVLLHGLLRSKCSVWMVHSMVSASGGDRTLVVQSVVRHCTDWTTRLMDSCSGYIYGWYIDSFILVICDLWVFIYLFVIYFKTVSVAQSNWLIMNLGEYRRKRSWPNLKWNPVICLEGTSNTGNVLRTAGLRTGLWSRVLQDTEREF